jgi:hypothetical protein
MLFQMEVIYKIDEPKCFSAAEKNRFLILLKKQNQVDNPSLEKINSCPFICIVSIDNEAIGIGAIKKVSKTPFKKAGIDELKDSFELEIGYLFVDNNSNGNAYRGFGIGKTITNLLLNKVEGKNVFATTELNINNPMIYILKSLGFKCFGNPYKGNKTKKVISLLLLIRTSNT